MANLDSKSTDQEVLAEYDDTASFEEDESRDKAKRHITACRIMTSRGLTRAPHDGSKPRFDPKTYERGMESARAFLAASRRPTVTHVDFRNFRS